MDAQILKVAGQVAGIGGIALAVVLAIFREVIRKNLFPQLSKDQGFRLMRLIVALTFSIGVIGIAAWVGVQFAPSKAGSAATAPAAVSQTIDSGGTGVIQTGTGQIQITNIQNSPSGNAKDESPGKSSR